MLKNEQDLNQNLQEKLKANKLESPFEWKMDSKTPERPFRDRFKLGHNKIAGKITVQTEENDFLAMTSYLNKQNHYIMQWKTFYPMKNLMLNHSKSNSNINISSMPMTVGKGINNSISQQGNFATLNHKELKLKFTIVFVLFFIFIRTISKQKAWISYT